MSFCRILLDTHPSVLFAVSLWCFNRFSRPCGLSVVGAWSSCAWVVFLCWAVRDGYKPIVLLCLVVIRGFWCLSDEGHLLAAALPEGSFSFETFLCCFCLCFFPTVCVVRVLI
jgi:hypothetical protein